MWHAKNLAEIYKNKRNYGLTRYGRPQKISVRRILKQYGIHGYRSIRKYFVTITQRRKIMLWANKHKEWSFSKWKNVVFSDESIFES